MTNQLPCRTTHRQIRLGRCPWCEVTLLEGQPGPEESAATFDNLWWDVATMMADLKDGDEQTRLDTVSNLVKHPPSVDDALRLIRVAECDPLEGVRDLTRKALCQLADSISIEDVGRYEAQYRDHPSDLATLTLILWVYAKTQPQSDSVRESHQQLLFWVVGTMPKAWFAGSPLVAMRIDANSLDQTKCLWNSHIEAQPRDAQLIGNAARFFYLMDEQKSEELFRLCKAIEPDNPEWAWNLGFRYATWSRRRQPRTHWASLSLAEYERVLLLAPDSDWAARAISPLADAAIESRDVEKARGYGETMLEQVPRLAGRQSRMGSALHEGHIILGRVALIEGDIGRAKRVLISAVTAPADQRVIFFGTDGPNTALARGLLDRNEEACVLDYFRRCASYWKEGRAHLFRWMRMIEEHRIPWFDESKRWY
jgi:hypothetical protein